MGFVFQFGKGPRIYMTGDTDYSDLLSAAARHRPDLMITCINGGFNNLSHWEAAQLAAQISPRAPYLATTICSRTTLSIRDSFGLR